MPVGELDGKVALVTGASRGLGRAIALRLAGLGAKVAANYLASDDKANGLVREIEGRGGEVMLAKADVADAKAVRAMCRQVVERWGKIDILVNNAGIVRDNLLPRMADDDWDSVINTNLRGAYLCTKFALRSMMEQFWGRIISIASLAGLVGNMGQTNYSAAKGGLIAFTRSVAREVGSRNITANAIAPGFINTEMTARLPDKVKETVLTLIAVKRYGNPEEVAELVGFLASERASYISGQVIGIDGGMIS